VRTFATVQRVLRPLEDSIHAARLKCFGRIVLAALVGARLSVTALGRALMTAGKTKHAIKRVDVFLANRHLVGDTEVVQQHLAGLMANVTRPVLLVDWTDIGTLWTALVATYVTEGRGLTLCWEVHPQSQTNSARIESKLLSRIATLLPAGAKPIVVTDAGFRGPWLEKVRQRGWDFVGRVRGRVKVRSEGKQWRDVKVLWAEARRTPTDLGIFEMARYRPVEARLVSLLPKRRQKKQQEAPPRVGRRRKRNIQSAREPLILATSLLTSTAKEVAELYRARWRIEMTFRDQKCSRFGLGLDAVRTKQLKRARAYVLLAVLAHYVAFILGAEAEQAGLAPQFQANTVKDRRVLSWPRLGCELLRRALTDFLLRRPSAPLVISRKCGDH
jgi:hypothetical protein